MDKRYIWFFVVMILLSPLGLIAEGTAWGEWGGEELTAALGYVPQGLEKAGGMWNAFLPDYSLKALGISTAGSVAGYILSAVVGSLLIYYITLLIIKLMARSQLHLQKNRK